MSILSAALSQLSRVGKPPVFVFFGVVITAIGELLGKPLVTVSGLLMSALGALWASGEQTESERELQSKNDEIARLNRRIACSITGGDSWCHVGFSLPEGHSNVAAMVLVHHGSYPLYDVGVRVVDLDKMDNLTEGKDPEDPLSLELIEKSETRIRVGNLSPGQALLLSRRLTLPSGDSARYNVFIAARNGFVVEKARLRRVEGRWAAAYKIEAGPGREEEEHTVLHQKIDALYPKNAEGEIDW